MPALRVAVTLVAAVALLFVLVGVGHMLPWHRPPPTSSAGVGNSGGQVASATGPDAVSHKQAAPEAKEHKAAPAQDSVLALLPLTKDKHHGKAHHGPDV